MLNIIMKPSLYPPYPESIFFEMIVLAMVHSNYVYLVAYLPFFAPFQKLCSLLSASEIDLEAVCEAQLHAMHVHTYMHAAPATHQPTIHVMHVCSKTLKTVCFVKSMATNSMFSSRILT